MNAKVRVKKEMNSFVGLSRLSELIAATVFLSVERTFNTCVRGNIRGCTVKRYCTK